MAWRLVDGSTGVIDRSTDTVTRECDSWLVHSESELLAILESIAGGGLRAMSLESDNHSVSFGFGGDISYVQGISKHRPYACKMYFRAIREEDCECGLDTGFMLWHDDLLEFCSEKLIPWSQALDILLWIVRHDELPDWDEEGVCRPLRGASSGSAEEESPF